MSDASQLLTPEEARRAMYVDFEGVPKEPPVMIGWVYAEGKKASEDKVVLRQDVFDKTLQLAVGHESLGGYLRHDQDRRSLGQSINDLARRAKAQDRRIVSWSQHELRAVVEAELSPGLRRMFERAYRDGKATAKRWRREVLPNAAPLTPGWGGAHKLVYYLDLIGYRLPADYGLGRTADRIRLVRTTLEREGTYGGLDSDAWAAWTGLLRHNAVDCAGLRAVVMKAARGLSA